jgi:oxygen-dependent protoporphyrinogen oxidase
LAFPGRTELQPALTASDLGPFTLAGDYLEFPNMEAALASSDLAAEAVLERLPASS